MPPATVALSGTDREDTCDSAKTQPRGAPPTPVWLGAPTPGQGYRPPRPNKGLTAYTDLPVQGQAALNPTARESHPSPAPGERPHHLPPLPWPASVRGSR